MKPSLVSLLPLALCLASFGYLRTPLAAQASGDLGVEVPIPVNPKATHLRTMGDDGALDPKPINLAAYGIVPGDTVRIRTLGDFLYTPLGVLQGTESLMVFSVNDVILPPTELNRIPGAISCGAPEYVTGLTWSGDLPTDVPYDFVNGDMEVVVPPGLNGASPWLFVGALDEYFGDNDDPELDFVVGITRTASGATNHILNGSFESPALLPGSDFLQASVGTSTITSWTVVGPAGANVAIIEASYSVEGINLTAGDGVQWIDLTGIASNQYEGIMQTIELAPGAYNLSFQLGNGVGPFSGVQSTVDLVINNVVVQSFTNDGPSGASLNWKQFGYTFSAGGLTSIEFRNADGPADHLNGLDNVVLTALVPTWTDLGSGLAGVSGIPDLAGIGALSAGTAGSLVLANATPSSLALLFVALNSTLTPFKCGTLVPVPVLTTLVLATSPAGEIDLAWLAWPAGLSGSSLYFQYAIQDAVGPCGASLSNALRANVP